VKQSKGLRGNRALWSEPGRAAWKLPAKLTVSEWAEKHRILDARATAEPGGWRNSRTPYLRGIMDAFVDPTVEEITLMAASQLGKTEACLNCLGYAIDQDPGPALFVMPREDDAKYFSQNRAKPMLEGCEVLRRHLSRKQDDLQQMEMRLDRMTIYFAGSNSPAGLASRPIRYLFLDETDKYPPFAGREADPIKLAAERTRTFWNRKIVKVSTPTTRHGYIFREYERSDRRQFYVPCPGCGHYQILVFPQVRWPEGERDPEKIRGERLAWYECESCGRRITDEEKPRILARGIWLAVGQSVDIRGHIKGEKPRTSHAGFWISGLYSPWLSWSDVAAEFLRSKDYPELLMNFKNSWLAEIWEEKAEETIAEGLRERIGNYPKGTCPAGVMILTAGVDIQKDHILFVIRGWGLREESWLIREGRVEDWPDLIEALFRTRYPRSSGEGDPLAVKIACIDSSHRTDEVYDFCRRWPEARPVKGQQKLKAPWIGSRVDYHPKTGGRMPRSLTLWHIDTTYFKDKIHRLARVGPGDPGEWHLHSEVSEDYIQQFCAEHKILIRDKRTGRSHEEWRLISAGAPNHFLDCEVYAAAAADMEGVRYFAEKSEERKIYRPRKIERRREEERRWIPRKRGWVRGRI